MRTLGDVELEIGTGKQQQELGVGKWTQEALMIDFQHNPKREEQMELKYWNIIVVKQCLLNSHCDRPEQEKGTQKDVQRDVGGG